MPSIRKMLGFSVSESQFLQQFSWGSKLVYSKNTTQINWYLIFIFHEILKGQSHEKVGVFFKVWGVSIGPN
jgi:hypothetical protein